MQYRTDRSLSGIALIISAKDAQSGAFKIVLCSDQARHFFCQQLRQLCVALAGQVHEVHLIELAVLCVQEVHALPLADDAELPGYTGGFFSAVLP